MTNNTLRTLKENQKRIFIIKKIDNKLSTLPGYDEKLDIKYKLFIHNILYQQTYKKLKFTDYVNINRDIMVKELGGDSNTFTKVKNFLLNNNVLDVLKNKHNKESYCAGLKSKQYKINSIYNDNINAIIVEDKYLEKLHKRKQKTFLSELQKDEDAHRMYIQFKYLRIHNEKALNYLNRKRRKYTLEEFTELQYNHQLLFINNFNSITDTFFTWKNIGKRHYTQLTNLNKEYRKFLYFDSELYCKENNFDIISNKNKLISIDIKNSQPLFLNKLIEKFKKEQNIYNYLINKIKINNIIYTYVVSFFQLSDCELTDKLNLEVQNYKQLTEEGLFYDYLMNKYNIKNRKKFKLAFFRDVLFGKIRKPYITKLEQIFLQEFPLIYLIIYYYKLKDYRNLSIQLQQLESNMIIRTICKRINEEYPHILLGTIHDSIICQNKFKDLVKFVIDDEFNKINLKANTQYEY